MAVRLVAVLLEGALVQLALAERADEVLRVELPVHGRDAPAHDRLTTGGAEGAAGRVVVRLAVGKAFVVEEVAGAERHAAFTTDKALGMPLLVQSADEAVQNRIGTGATTRGKQLVIVTTAVDEAVLFVETLGIR